MCPYGSLLLAPPGSFWLFLASPGARSQEGPGGAERPRRGPQGCDACNFTGVTPPRKRVPINDPTFMLFFAKVTYKTLSFMLVEEILGAGVFIIHFVFPFLLCGFLVLHTFNLHFLSSNNPLRNASKMLLQQYVQGFQVPGL